MIQQLLNQKQQKFSTKKPDPGTAVMLAAMSAAVYILYQDYTKKDTINENERKQIEQRLKKIPLFFAFNRTFVEQVMDRKISKNKDSRYLNDIPEAYLGKVTGLLSGFKIQGLLTADKALIYGQDPSFIGVFATRTPKIKNKSLEILIAFRGTQGNKEILHDLNAVITKPIHRGFFNIFNSIKDDLKQLINNAQLMNNVDNKNIKIYITGHSLGGALAILSADFLMNYKFSVDVYTFGSPRMGSFKFKKDFEQKLDATNSSCFRLGRWNDVIVYLPPKFMEYKHVGVLIKLNENLDQKKQASPKNTSYKNFWEELEKLDEEIPKDEDQSSYLNKIINIASTLIPQHDILQDRDSVFAQFAGQVKLQKQQQQISSHLSYESPNAYSVFGSSFDSNLANKPMLLNGEKVIFDKAVTTTPVTIEPKTTPRQLYINKKSY